MDQKLVKQMTEICHNRVRQNELLAAYTTWGIGGPAKVIAFPETREELQELARLVQAHRLPCFVLGNGSNILVPDEGFAGLVVTFRKNREQIKIRGNHLKATAGTRLQSLINTAQEKGLSGLEELCGIPGTVGGALATNAGVPGRCIGDQVAAMSLVSPGGEFKELEPTSGTFTYRSSRVKAEGTVWEAEFQVEPAEPETIKDTIKQLIQKRKKTQPLGQKSAGSVFKNPPGKPAGQLIDECGCRGWQEGDAWVSDRHANFIINQGRASACQVLRLMERVQEKVQKKTGIKLEPEVEIIG
jgi:UDP-N-acetylmuramate dehydrogenase